MWSQSIGSIQDSSAVRDFQASTISSFGYSTSETPTASLQSSQSVNYTSSVPWHGNISTLYSFGGPGASATMCMKERGAYYSTLRTQTNGGGSWSAIATTTYTLVYYNLELAKAARVTTLCDGIGRQVEENIFTSSPETLTLDSTLIEWVEPSGLPSPTCISWHARMLGDE